MDELPKLTRTNSPGEDEVVTYAISFSAKMPDASLTAQLFDRLRVHTEEAGATEVSRIAIIKKQIFENPTGRGVILTQETDLLLLFSGTSDSDNPGACRLAGKPPRRR